MNSKVFFVLLLAVVGVAVFGLTTKPQSSANASNSNSDEISLESNYQSQSARMGAVDVEITPEKLEFGETSIFEVSFNTHSVDLDYDFTSIMTLMDNNGTRYKATEWVGGSGGHHLSGAIGFEKLNENAESVTLKIDGIDGTETTLTWQL